MKDKVRYYSAYTDDFVVSKNQNFKIGNDYKWINKSFVSKILSFLIYMVAIVAGGIYSLLHLGLHYKGKKKIRGAFIFGNHTQPIGDIFIPAFASLPTRIYVVVSPANYGIPIIGKILPYLGALPLPDTVSGMKKFTDAIYEHIENGKNVVIYPEAHVWEYYTEIRPFQESSFKLAVKSGAPVYCTTTTYQKRKFGKLPKTTVYVDGPFYADQTIAPKIAAEKLRDEVRDCMIERSRESTYEYIKYKQKDA